MSHIQSSLCDDVDVNAPSRSLGWKADLLQAMVGYLMNHYGVRGTAEIAVWTFASGLRLENSRADLLDRQVGRW